MNHDLIVAASSLVGGAALYWFSKLTRESYVDQEKEIRELEKKPILQLNQLQQILTDEAGYDYLKKSNQTFIVEGSLHRNNGDPLLSLD
jgi:hypothetical protein